MKCAKCGRETDISLKVINLDHDDIMCPSCMAQLLLIEILASTFASGELADKEQNGEQGAQK